MEYTINSKDKTITIFSEGGNVEERPDLQTLLSSLSSSGKAGGTARLSSQRAV